MTTGRWRVGRKVPRNIYRDDEPVAMVAGAKAVAEATAKLIVDILNEHDTALRHPYPGTIQWGWVCQVCGMWNHAFDSRQGAFNSWAWHKKRTGHCAVHVEDSGTPKEKAP